MIGSNIFLVWIPVLIRQTIDQIQHISTALEKEGGSVREVLLSEEAGWLLAQNSGTIIGAVLMFGVLLFATRQTIIVASRKIEFDIRNDLYRHLQKLPQSFYDKNSSGDIYTRLTEDIVRVREYFGPAFMYLINTASRSGIIISIMIMVHPGLTFYALLPLPVLAILAYWISRFINRRSTEIQQQFAVMSSKIQEIYSSIQIVKAFNRETYQKERFLKESDIYRKKKLRLDIVEALFFPTLLFLIGISIMLVVWQGGMMVMDGRVTVGNIVEFVIYVTYLTWPVASLGYTLNLLQRSAASNARIQTLFAEKTENLLLGKTVSENSGKSRDNVLNDGIVKELTKEKNPSELYRPGDFETDKDSYELRFEGVGFTYPGAKRPALTNIHLEVNKGDRVGIVGRTGSGKTTLVQLIPRLYDVNEGQILLRGRDIRDYDLRELRSMTGFIPQDVFLFSDTLRENIGFGKEDASMEEIYQAAENAEILKNILDFNNKFDTIAGERGITLSGGQKQRTGIARALIRQPEILIMDDSLNAVDAETEDAIIGRLNSTLKNSTMFIVCHRFSSLKYANKVYVLDEGQIVESGSPAQLQEGNGLYAQMFRRQQIEEELRYI